MTLGVSIRWYAHEQLVTAAPDGARPYVAFLCGPTTDARPDGCDTVAGIILSAWRASVLRSVLARTHEVEADVALTLVVPEFPDKLREFREHAEEMFGSTLVPAGLPCKRTSWGVLQWERRQLHDADRVLVWCDFRDHQPGLGLNARPEVAELLATSARRVSLAISDRCTASTRFWAQAHEAAITPGTTLDDLAYSLLAALRT